MADTTTVFDARSGAVSRGADEQAPAGAAAPASPGASAPQMLALKVMRLSRPAFAVTRVQVGGDEEATSTTLGTSSSSPSPASSLPPLEDMLRLPAAFGSVYLGETFSAYLALANDTAASGIPRVLTGVAIKAELQTSTQRITLLDTPEHALRPDETRDFVANHEIKELGVHILVCSVSYAVDDASASAQAKTSSSRAPPSKKFFFRKFFKFQVANPFAVVTKINADRFAEALYLQIHLQNAATQSLVVERMRFDCADVFEHIELDPATDLGGATTSDTRQIRLRPDDVCQFLYVITPRAGQVLRTKTAASLGKLDIAWRNDDFGMPGRLQTANLPRKLGRLDKIGSFESLVGAELVRVVSPSSYAGECVVIVEQPFTAVLRLWNYSTTDTFRVRVAAVKAKMSSILAFGPAETGVDVNGEELRLEPGECRDVALALFPLIPGIHRITGLRATDVHSGFFRDFGAGVGEVLVMQKANVLEKRM